MPGTGKGWTDTRFALRYSGLAGQGPRACPAVPGHVPVTTGGSAIAILLLHQQGIRPKDTPGGSKVPSDIANVGGGTDAPRRGADTRGQGAWHGLAPKGAHWQSKGAKACAGHRLD